MGEGEARIRKGFICEWGEICYVEGHTGSPEWRIAVPSTVVRVRLCASKLKVITVKEGFFRSQLICCVSGVLS